MTEREISPHYPCQNAVSEFHSLQKMHKAMVLIFSGIVKYKQFSSHLRKKSDFPCDRSVLVFLEKKKRSAVYIFFFFRQRICKLFCPFLLLGFENIDLFRLFPKFYLLESFIPSVIRFCIPNLSKLFIIGLVIFFWRCFNIHNMNYTARWICVFV